MLSRDQVVALLPQYINSCSEDNSFLGDNEILRNIKTGYEVLGPVDKQYVQAQFKTLENAAFPREAKTQFVAEYKRDLLIGAIAGAATGAGAHIYNAAYSGGTFFLGKYIAKTAVKNTVVGGCLGAFLYPFLKNPAKARKFNHTSRPYTQLKAVLDLGIGLTNARNVIAHISAGAENDARQSLGLRRRR